MKYILKPLTFPLKDVALKIQFYQQKQLVFQSHDLKAMQSFQVTLASPATSACIVTKQNNKFSQTRFQTDIFPQFITVPNVNYKFSIQAESVTELPRVQLFHAKLSSTSVSGTLHLALKSVDGYHFDLCCYLQTQVQVSVLLSFEKNYVRFCEEILTTSPQKSGLYKIQFANDKKPVKNFHLVCNFMYQIHRKTKYKLSVANYENEFVFIQGNDNTKLVVTNLIQDPFYKETKLVEHNVAQQQYVQCFDKNKVFICVFSKVDMKPLFIKDIQLQDVNVTYEIMNKIINIDVTDSEQEAPPKIIQLTESNPLNSSKIHQASQMANISQSVAVNEDIQPILYDQEEQVFASPSNNSFPNIKENGTAQKIVKNEYNIRKSPEIQYNRGQESTPDTLKLIYADGNVNGQQTKLQQSHQLRQAKNDVNSSNLMNCIHDFDDVLSGKEIHKDVMSQSDINLLQRLFGVLIDGNSLQDIADQLCQQVGNAKILDELLKRL
ncbi:Hypothetical_protein [Hexamita inflata]|uniref:Hypothetical_protein n=1 Tax=Hexamita inflata TaxID=28002 RepID=A0AA86QBC9_9EUKA|nr:Hypothetical protein HINF_LOCUS36700 [Hexamita inflata]